MFSTEKFVANRGKKRGKKRHGGRK